MAAYVKARRCASSATARPGPTIFIGTCARIADQEPQGRDRGHDHRLFDQWLVEPQFRAGDPAALQQQGQATSTGAMPATLTQVMTGQIDIGFAVPPIGFQQLEDGRIGSSRAPAKCPEARTRPCAPRLPAARLAKDPELMARFIRGYADTIDWMYSSDPKVLEIYEDFSRSRRDLRRGREPISTRRTCSIRIASRPRRGHGRGGRRQVPPGAAHQGAARRFVPRAAAEQVKLVGNVRRSSPA